MGLLSQAVTDSSNPWVVFGGGSALVAVIALFVNSTVRNQRATTRITELYEGPIQLLKDQIASQGERIQRQDRRLAVLEEHIRRCERANDALVRTVEKNGLDIPVDVLLWRRRDSDE